MIKVNYRALGMLSTNCYVLENPDSQKVLIVDPGDKVYEGIRIGKENSIDFLLAVGGGFGGGI